MTVYQLVQYHEEGADVLFVTHDRAIAERMVELDSDLDIDEMEPLTEVPPRGSELTIGENDHGHWERERWEWNPGTSDAVHMSGTSSSPYWQHDHWRYWLEIRGYNHAKVREVFAERLAEIKAKMVVPPNMPTVEIAASKRVTKLLKVPLDTLTFVRVGLDWDAGRPVLVALSDGREVRKLIDENEARKLMEGAS